MTTKQLVVFAAAVIVLTLTLAWLIERRTVLSLRQELNTWGQVPDALPLVDDSGEITQQERSEGGPIVGWDEDETVE